MASEQFSLCWDNFHKNMSSGMNSLLESEDLVDVTIAVEGKFLKAHKMVLSVCSPYFKDLFKGMNPYQHPVIFMKDVSYVAISDLLQFMYQGEVQVSQENLTTFIKTAEALQIKGLTGDGNGSLENENEKSQTKNNNSTEPHITQMPRPKVQRPAPGPVVTSTPVAKKPRLSQSSEPAATLLPTKQEPVAPVQQEATAPPVHFKMEPYDQNQSVTIPDDDDQDTEQGFDDTHDDTEDYSMMEGDEQQAGTSADGAGEGQAGKIPTGKNSTASLLNNIMKTQNTILVNLAKIAKNQKNSDSSIKASVQSVYDLLLTQSLFSPLNKDDPKEPKESSLSKKFQFPLLTVDEVFNFDKELSTNEEYLDFMMRTYASIGGNDGNEEGRIVAKNIRNILFAEEVLTQFSWTGMSRTSGLERKHIFQKCEGILNFFLRIVAKADNRWSTSKNEKFFKHQTLKHAKQLQKARLKKIQKTQHLIDEPQDTAKTNTAFDYDVIIDSDSETKMDIQLLGGNEVPEDSEEITTL